MPKLIKNNEISTDNWEVVSAEEANALSAEKLQSGFWLLPLEAYKNIEKGADFNAARVGIWLASDENVLDLYDICRELPVIALNFNAFADGRSFSQARMIREQLDYKGEVRAIGAFIQDQLTYLRRCGFDAFSVSDDADTESMLISLYDFSDAYQAGCDDPRPLFRRRA